jgi:hypothetical protein
MKKPEKWIKTAVNPKKEGCLHRQLGIPQKETIPKKTLHDIANTNIGKHSHGIKVTKLVKQRSVFALNAQKRRK